MNFLDDLPPYAKFQGLFGWECWMGDGAGQRWLGGTCSHLKDCTPWIASQIPQSKLVMVEGQQGDIEKWLAGDCGGSDNIQKWVDLC